MKHKVEMKGSLWEVTFQKGSYSDWDIEFFLFSGNDENEVWEFVKIWASEAREFEWLRRGMKWNGEKFKYPLFDDREKKYYENETWWDDYDYVDQVDIKRAHVIYVNP